MTTLRCVLIGLALASCGEVATPSDDNADNADTTDNPGDIDAAAIDAEPGPPDAAWPAQVVVAVQAPDSINANCPQGEFIVTLTGPADTAVDLAITLPEGGTIFPELDGPVVLDGSGQLILTTFPGSAIEPSMTMEAATTDDYQRQSVGSGTAFVFADGPFCAVK